MSATATSPQIGIEYRITNLRITRIAATPETTARTERSS